MTDRLPAIERLLVVANLLNADISEGAPIWEWTPEEAEALVRRLIDATEAAGIEYDTLMEDSAPAAEPAQAGEGTVWRVESSPRGGWNLVGEHFRIANSLWQRLDHGMWTCALWDGPDQMRAAGYVLTEVPAATAEDGGGE
jgi:hypothetical protein